MKITNAKVFIDGWFHDDLEVRFDDERILEIGRDLKDDEVIDGKGNYLYAGIIDSHMHGGWLRNFNDIKTLPQYGDIEEQVRYILKQCPKYGVTTVFPTLTGISDEERISSCRAIRKVRKDVDGADPMKIHFECTYMNPNVISSAIHDWDVNPSMENTLYFTDNDLSDVALICLAPELEGSMDWIRWVTSQGVDVEFGNTWADVDTIREAVDAGVRHCDHIFNGFKPMHHRESTPTVGVLLDDRVKTQITMDGFHVAPAWVKLVVKVKGIDNCYGITDFSVYSGIEPGEYEFSNGVKIIAKDDFIYNGNGHIQSGNNTMDKMMRRCRDICGFTQEEVASLYCENRAKCLNITDRGKIEVGRRSDFVLMDKDYNVLKTIIKGRIYYESDSAL